MSEFEYKESKKAEYRNKSEELLEKLPSFCKTYSHGIEGTISPITMYEYLQHLYVFFRFLCGNNSHFASIGIRNISYGDISPLTVEDIEEFMYFIRHGRASSLREDADKGSMKEAASKSQAGGSKKANKEVSVNHYLCALNSLWDYAVSRRYLPHNIIKDIKRGKRNGSKEVITLDRSDEHGLFQSITYGTNLTLHQGSYRNDATIARDYAICLILIKTGLRVSELVGIDISDIDFKECYFRVNRKEDKIDKVFFSDSVKEALENYLRLRHLLAPAEEEKALFLVTVGKHKGRRLSVRSVQLLVKKYALAGVSKDAQRITPHKMRSTYATNLLKATGGDLTLVQEALNHESPTTTSIYLQKREQDLREARNMIDED